jgi:hypothetical protein
MFLDCILIYVSMYLCIYKAKHLHTVYLDWPQVGLQQFEVHLNMTIGWTQGYTPRLWLNKVGDTLGGSISNNSSLRQKHQGVPDGSDGSDCTSYPLTENYTLPVALLTGRSLLDWCSALQAHLEAPGSTSNHSRAVWENNFFFRNTAGAPGNHSYY